MKAISIIDRVVTWLSTSLMILASIIAFILMTVIVSDVVVRTTSGHGLPGAVELTEVFLVAIVFLAWAAAQRAGTHVSIDLLFDRLNPTAQRIISVFGLILVIVCLTPIVGLSFEAAYEAYVTGEFRIGVTNTPVWPARAAVAIGLLAVVLEIVTMLLEEIERWSQGRSSVVDVEPDPELMV